MLSLCNFLVCEKKKRAFLESSFSLKEKFIPKWEDFVLSRTKDMK